MFIATQRGHKNAEMGQDVYGAWIMAFSCSQIVMLITALVN